MSDRINPRDRIIDVKVLGQLIDNACGYRPPQGNQGCCQPMPSEELHFAHKKDIDRILGIDNEDDWDKPHRPNRPQ